MENYTSDSSSDNDEKSDKVLDLAYLSLESDEINNKLVTVMETRISDDDDIISLILHHNQLKQLPQNIDKFKNIRTLDISNNGLISLPNISETCPNLVTLIIKNNSLHNETLPKQFSPTPSLKELNLSGNLLDNFPEQIFSFRHLKYLYLGGNQIRNISRSIWKLKELQVLAMGGNQLTGVPTSLGLLNNLQALVLCDNQIESLPSNIANLHNIKSLFLHKNKLRTLPPEIIALKNLTELSLRDNPLVVRFISNMIHNPTSLLELSARTIKLYNINVGPGDIPKPLVNYLHSAHHCVNPNCKGVYFDNRVEHIKFVDFCGKYRIPLLQYLCSSKCANGADDEIVRPSRSYLMKKVLLG